MHERKTVLIVEDDPNLGPMLLEVLDGHLEGQNVLILLAATLQEALACLRDHKASIVGMTMDGDVVRGIKSNGDEMITTTDALVRKVLQEKPELPIFAYPGVPEGLERLKAAGAKGVPGHRRGEEQGVTKGDKGGFALICEEIKKIVEKR